jgi:hypothetical protein
MAPLTRGQAIAAKCRDCIHDPSAPGTWREQVAQCSCPGCPLWPLRPAPSGGPFADPPRDPATVSREWLRQPVGMAVSGHPRHLSPMTEPTASDATPEAA